MLKMLEYSHKSNELWFGLVAYSSRGCYIEEALTPACFGGEMDGHFSGLCFITTSALA